jgi:hypothetical protein
LKIANPAVAAASTVGHQRAEIIARESAFECYNHLADYAAAREHVTKALVLSRRLGAKRFEAEDLICTALLDFQEGKIGAAIENAEAALALCRAGGMKFIGPAVLGALARITADSNRRRDALAEGEALLHSGVLKHNHIWFYRQAMDLSLETAQWPEARRYADALEASFRDEPAPWSSFLAQRGRALAAWGEDTRDAAAVAELERLRGEGDRMGYLNSLPLIEKALSGKAFS